MSLRPDLIACWIYRIPPARELEVLLIRRASDRMYPGMWQCVTGGLEAGERIVDGALREVAEETGITAADIEALYTLDQANIFHADHVDALLVEAVFAAQVRPGAEPRLSHEHDGLRWVSVADAAALIVWPAHQTALRQLEWLVAHPEHERYFRVGAWATERGLPPGPASQ